MTRRQQERITANLTSLPPKERARRYVQGCLDGNPYADLLVFTVPKEEREAFQRAALMTTRVMTHLSGAQTLRLKVENSLLRACLGLLRSDADIEQLRRDLLPLTGELRAYERLYDEAVRQADPADVRIQQLGRLNAETRSWLQNVQTVGSHELLDLDAAPEDAEMAAILLGDLL